MNQAFETKPLQDIFERAEQCKLAGDYAQAEVYFRQILLWQPNHLAACNSLGWVLRKQAKWVEALLAFRACIALQPDHVQAHANLSLVLLQLGDYANGWREYEYRLLDEPSLRPALPFAHWQGQPVQGKRILLVQEQGLGDMIQFSRYASLLAQQGAIVDLLVSAPLVALLQTLAGVRWVGDQLQTTQDAYDYQCQIMSLPYRFATTLHNVPAQTPYLQSSAAQRQVWQQRLQQCVNQANLRVGLVWAGANRSEDPVASAFDIRRSLALQKFLPVLQVRGVDFFSLQIGPAAAQLQELDVEVSDGTNAAVVNAEPDPFAKPKIYDLTQHINDFADTAALVGGLDLVISCDTSTAHLAGALGKPVWILNRHDLCWRWLSGRSDSPWYPSARLFVQPQAGDWDTVMQEVAKSLQELVQQRSDGTR